MKRPNPQACAEAFERIRHCMHIDGHDGGSETVVGMTLAQRDAIVLALKFCAREPDGCLGFYPGATAPDEMKDEAEVKREIERGTEAWFAFYYQLEIERPRGK